MRPGYAGFEGGGGWEDITSMRPGRMRPGYPMSNVLAIYSEFRLQ